MRHNQKVRISAELAGFEWLLLTQAVAFYLDEYAADFNVSELEDLIIHIEERVNGDS